jgi:hypothetical protein
MDQQVQLACLGCLDWLSDQKHVTENDILEVDNETLYIMKESQNIDTYRSE